MTSPDITPVTHIEPGMQPRLPQAVDTLARREHPATVVYERLVGSDREEYDADTPAPGMPTQVHADRYPGQGHFDVNLADLPDDWQARLTASAPGGAVTRPTVHLVVDHDYDKTPAAPDTSSADTRGEGDNAGVSPAAAAAGAADVPVSRPRPSREELRRRRNIAGAFTAAVAAGAAREAANNSNTFVAIPPRTTEYAPAAVEADPDTTSADDEPESIVPAVATAATVTGALAAGELATDDDDAAAASDLGEVDADGYPVSRTEAFAARAQSRPEAGGKRGSASRRWIALLALIGAAGGLLAADAGPHGHEAVRYYAKVTPGADARPHQEQGKGALKLPPTVVDPNAYSGKNPLWNEAAQHYGTEDATPELLDMVADARAMGDKVVIKPVKNGKFSIPEIITPDGKELRDTGSKWTELIRAKIAHKTQKAVEWTNRILQKAFGRRAGTDV